MPKRVTPYSVQLAKKKEKQKGKVQKTGPWIEIWVRLKRNKMAVAGRLLPIRKHREERENGIASAVPFSHFSVDAVTFDISKTPIPL